MVIAHNLTAMNAQRQYGITGRRKSGSAEKLASGFKVNRAADDAAGLAISEKMRRQIRGLTQASSNASDGISMVQTAEGGLNEVHDMLQRMNELSVKAANGTLTDVDRQYIDKEYQNLKSEINRVANTTTFNEIQLFPPDGSSMYAAEYDIKINADGTTTVKMLSDAYTVGDTKATDNAKATATYLASLIPTTINDILNAYPSLKGAEDLTIKLDLKYVDGGNGTLAHASFSYYTGNYAPVTSSFMVTVDTADFTDSNALPGGDRNDLLKATLAHELTHTIMQYTMTKSMVSEMPKWFKEGAAQMSGGGFSTGWLSDLATITNGLTSGDTSKDEAIKKYLKSYTVDGRPYGHGFLATAYAAYLAAGSDMNKLADGLNDIFDRIKNQGQTFEQAIKGATGLSSADIVAKINSGDISAIDFARELSIATGTGAGSVVYGLPNGSQNGGSLPSDASKPTDIKGATSVFLQVGSEAGQNIELELFSIGTQSLGLDSANTLTTGDAGDSIDSVKNAIGVVSSIRSYYGAMQNRLEHTIKNLDNVVENTTAAESQIRDTDMAKEMVTLSMLNILDQAGVAMMTQANQSNQNVLSLLG